VPKAQGYIVAGNRWALDLAGEKFFDRVNHDTLMAAIARRGSDKRMLRLIRALLESGLLENGLVSPGWRVRGKKELRKAVLVSPQLSKLVRDELDRDLEQRKRRFVGYAEDGNIYLRGERRGNESCQA
jgi:RNA-directed DNA polymerase